VLLAVGCQRAPSRYFGTTKPRHGPDEAWTNLGAEPEWIDSGKCSDSSGGTVLFNLFAGLTQPHPDTLLPMPDVARGWDISVDGLHYTFHLRPTTWSDGVPVTARDFEYSWKRVIDRRTGSKYASFLFPIQNAETFNKGEVGADAVGVHATDDLTLDVTLEHPVPYFLDLVGYYTAFPVPRHVIERLERAGQNPDLWTRTANIVSNGPFTLAEWKFRQFMLLKKNPRYWDAQHVRLERVRMLMVESVNTTLNLYAAGEIDSIGNSALPSEFMDYLAQFRDFQRRPSLATYFLWLNTAKKPLDDARVRRALSLAVDRESLVKYVTRAGQIPSADLVPDGLAGYRGPHSPVFDPARARALLAEAGYGPGRPLPPITLRYNTSEGHKQIAEAVAQMWKQHLGIPVEIENQEWKVYLKSLEQKDFQIARLGWVGDYPDPNTFLELLTEGSGNNHSNWKNAEYEALLREANSTRDRAQRMGLLLRAETLAMSEVPLVPLYVYTRSELVKPYVVGHFLNYQQRLLFKYWSIDTRFYTGAPDPLPPQPPPLALPESVKAAGSAQPIDAGAGTQVAP
jgi:oligopeptide transport system substrate-binding protein